MQKPVLVIMAAGMGSRYGGLKQIDPVGPGGQIILDYSIYDAHRVGFERVVFIIRPELHEAFELSLIHILPNLIAVLLLSGVIARETRHYLNHLDEKDETEIPVVDR